MSTLILSSRSTEASDSTIETSTLPHNSSDGTDSCDDATTLIGSSLAGSMKGTLSQRHFGWRKEWTHERDLSETHDGIVYQFHAFCVCRKPTPCTVGGFVRVKSGDGDAPLFQVDFRLKSHRENEGDGTLRFWFICPLVDEPEPRKFGEAEFFLKEDYQDAIKRLKAEFTSRFDAEVKTREELACLTAPLKDSLFRCLQDACEEGFSQLQKHDARIERKLARKNFFRVFCCCSS